MSYYVKHRLKLDRGISRAYSIAYNSQSIPLEISGEMTLLLLWTDLNKILRMPILKNSNQCWFCPKIVTLIA